jgi:hypothetical protein
LYFYAIKLRYYYLINCYYFFQTIIITNFTQSDFIKAVDFDNFIEFDSPNFTNIDFIYFNVTFTIFTDYAIDYIGFIFNFISFGVNSIDFI